MATLLDTIENTASRALGGNQVNYNRQEALITLAKAISLQESSTDGKTPDYNRIGDNGTSAGAYQWNNNGKALKPGQIPAEFAADAKAAGLNPNDFSPENQNKVALATITKMADEGMGPAQIAAAWNGGMAKALSGAWKTNVGTTTINGKKIQYNTPAYVAKVNSYYQQLYGESQS